MPDILPKAYEFSHGLCIFLHNELVAIVKGLEQGGFLSISITRRPGLQFPDASLQGDALFDWLEQNGYEDILGQLYVRTLLPALIADFCHFTLEALNCSRKGKLTVTYALLRKPLRENLFYLEQLAADTDNFLNRFHHRPITELALTGSQAMKPTITGAVARTQLPTLYDADLLWTLRYDRNAPESFANLWDKAIHLITSFRAIQTEPRNLNFIFSDELSHADQWVHLYTRLPLLLAYTLDLSLALAGDLLGFPLPPLREMIIHRQISFALWLDECSRLQSGRATSRESLRLLRILGVDCRHCKRALTTKRGLRSLYMTHQFTCPVCKTGTNLADIADRAS